MVDPVENLVLPAEVSAVITAFIGGHEYTCVVAIAPGEAGQAPMTEVGTALQRVVYDALAAIYRQAKKEQQVDEQVS